VRGGEAFLAEVAGVENESVAPARARLARDIESLPADAVHLETERNAFRRFLAIDLEIDCACLARVKAAAIAGHTHINKLDGMAVIAHGRNLELAALRGLRAFEG